MKGFKEFLSQGNVIDLAVAVVIGTAFTALVTTVVTGVINPLISAVFNANSLNKALVVDIPTVSGGHSHILFGSVVGAVINFIIIAAVVYFAFVLPYQAFAKRRAAAQPAVDEAQAAPSQEQLLTQIRDLLALRTDFSAGKHTAE